MGGLRMVPLRITGTGRVKPLTKVPSLRKPKGLVAQYPGHVVALDTFEEHINGTRRYIITFIDIYTRFGFALATSSHASLAARDFFGLCQSVFPFSFESVLTDNGSEFKKHFSASLLDLHLTHFHTRPRTPKQNAHSERFNRTVQEEFANYHRRELWVDLDTFNRKLFEWLYWYNSERVHFAFGNKLTPIQFMLSLDLATLPVKCQSGWPYT
jgi:transposase InsO family protein